MNTFKKLSNLNVIELNKEEAISISGGSNGCYYNSFGQWICHVSA